MAQHPIKPEGVEYRVVLIEPCSLHVFTSNDIAGSPALPRQTIPAHSRIAEALTEAIYERYGIRSLQLALLIQADGTSRCAVHEVLNGSSSEDRPPLFQPIGNIAGSDLTGEERTVLLKIAEGNATELGTFAQLGWIDALIGKIRMSSGQNSLSVVRQLNQGKDFCLLSLSTQEGNEFWFKAVGEPNLREYPVTLELTRLFPRYLPKLVTCIPEWNGWVTEGILGKPLNQSGDKHNWDQTLTALAAMQKTVASNTSSLRAAGAEDWSSARLLDCSKPFFVEAARAMQAQTVTNVAPLSSEDLERLKLSVDAALRLFIELAIPETLLHGDIGHGNVLISSNGPLFLDWAETYIGHPFISAEHLLADFERSYPQRSEDRASLRLAYAAHWLDFADPDTLATTCLFSPAVAAFAYAVMAWDANLRRGTSTRAWPLIRSMLRRTKRELQIAEVAA